MQPFYIKPETYIKYISLYIYKSIWYTISPVDVHIIHIIPVSVPILLSDFQLGSPLRALFRAGGVESKAVALVSGFFL